MHKENEDEKKQQEKGVFPPEIVDQLDELSDVWRELLGNRSSEKKLPVVPGNASIPTLEADPWSALLQAKGVEVVDLQCMHLHISDQEVEQILQVISDDPDTRDKAPKGVSGHLPSDGDHTSSRRTDTH